MSNSIADVKTQMDAIAAAIAPLASSLPVILAALKQLQDNAANQSSSTHLSADDQSALDAAVAEGAQAAQSLQALSASLPAAQAAASAPAADPAAPSA